MIELALLAGLAAAVTFHTGRFVGGKLAQVQNPAVARFGAALAGTFTFGVPA